MKEKERLKEESKRMKKLENNFKNLLRELNVDFELPWEEVKLKLENEEEFTAFSSDSERCKIYRVSNDFSVQPVPNSTSSNYPKICDFFLTSVYHSKEIFTPVLTLQKYNRVFHF